MKPSLKIKQSAQDRTVQKLLKAQWLISWRFYNSKVARLLPKLVYYLNAELVLYAIEVAKKTNVSNYYSLKMVTKIIFNWKRRRIHTVQAAQRDFQKRRLKSRPWNSEMEHRVLGPSVKHRWVNNAPHHFKIPKAFRSSH